METDQGGRTGIKRKLISFNKIIQAITRSPIKQVVRKVIAFKKSAAPKVRLVKKIAAAVKVRLKFLLKPLSPVTVAAQKVSNHSSKFSIELLVLLLVLGTAYFSHAHSFNGLLVSYQNDSDAFKFIQSNENINQKLADAAKLANADHSLVPKAYAFSDAAEQSEENSTNASGSAIVTAASASAVVKPNLTVRSSINTEGNIGVYKVTEGDNPTVIAERFGIGLASLLKANELNDASLIKPGQELKVPLCNGILYEIKPDDTLESLDKKFKLQEENITDDDLLNCNDVEVFEDMLALGTIVIPQNNLEIPHAPRSRYAGVTTNTTGRISLGVAQTPSSFSGGSGSLLWPVPASRRITQWYSWRHNGFDISGLGQNPGPVVVASDDCFVEIAGWQRGGWGNTVVCNHGNGIKTRYAHMSTIDVKAGQTVQKGQALGRIGNTGRSTGPHLHFTVYINGRSSNPTHYLAGF